MLILISDDNLTIQCSLNQNNPLIYRAIALRNLHNQTNFHEELKTLLNNEDESTEIRIIAFQILLPYLNSTDLNHLIEATQSNQLRFYIKSLSKQSSIWLRNSGTYEFPFGKMNIIFNENTPKIIQLELTNHIEIDFYLITV